MNKRLFGIMPSGESVHIYRISCGDAYAEITEYGASLVTLCPFGDVDVVGGFDTLDGYLADDSNQGGIVGRVANRIAKAQFALDGRVYHLPQNDHGNCLHGGNGFNHRLWTVVDHTEGSLTLSYVSSDGEEGFPAELAVEVTYEMQGHALLISYRAIPDGTTPIALTNHAYFNLDGLGGDVGDHLVQIWADRYTEVDEELIPTGNRPSVDGTVFDMRAPRRIGEAFSEPCGGYDHNMILSPTSFKRFYGRELGLAARVEGQSTVMQVYTDQPGLQFYTGNFLGNGGAFKAGIPRRRHGAFCMEAQTEPNCINCGEAFYARGEVYRQLTVYEFSTKQSSFEVRS